MPGEPSTCDVLVSGADLVATMDPDRREIPGGWVAITDGAVSGVGAPGDEPAAAGSITANGCLVTPGLVNTHHHIFQNLTRAYLPATSGNLFGWLTTLYPIWAGLDEEASYLSAWIGLAELALGGCTTSMDHLYVHPAGGGDLIAAEIAAATELGVRFHATRGSMSRSQKDGGLPPDSVVQDDDTILAESERLVHRHHQRDPLAMVQVALAPCSPFSVTPALMTADGRAGRAARRPPAHPPRRGPRRGHLLPRDLRVPAPRVLFEDVGWGTDRSWVAHCVYPNPDGGGATRLVGHRRRPLPELEPDPRRRPRARSRSCAPPASPVGIGCDGSASADSASLWMETRNALLLGRLRHGPGSMQARDALEMATRGGAACLGRDGEIGELSLGAAGDVAVWPLEGVALRRSALRPDRGVAALRTRRATPHDRGRTIRGRGRSAPTSGARRPSGPSRHDQPSVAGPGLTVVTS